MWPACHEKTHLEGRRAEEKLSRRAPQSTGVHSAARNRLNVWGSYRFVVRLVISKYEPHGLAKNRNGDFDAMDRIVCAVLIIWSTVLINVPSKTLKRTT